ncbi:MAG: toll/interleukin-1 receptor domain-containing protein [Clostridia bacterium]|nr:toll/interleukin-1 receptor domain-containing protein [Clostridia bacterium]
MSMISHNCRHCGSVFEFRLELAVCPCPACGTPHERPRSEGESLTWLRRANEERANCDYANAEATYRQVLGRHPEEHEALWGLVMCKFGVELVEGKPTIHFLRRQDILADRDYLRACQLAEEKVARNYRETAEYISQIQGGIPPKGEEYDVFLCYKGSGRVKGTFAQEYFHAYQLYLDLQKAGLKVFFAHETLKGMAGAKYEALIFHALYSAKAMLVVCSDPDNLGTPWVHSEWTRYLERIYAGEGCLLITMLYDNCSPYSLPHELRGLQGIQVGPSQWWETLMENLQRVTDPKQKEKKADSVNVARMRLPVEYALKSGDWGNAASRAKAYCEKYPDRAEGYMYQLLAKLKQPAVEALAASLTPFENDVDWQFAMQQADDAQAAAWSAVLEKSQALRRKKEEERIAEEKRIAEENRRAEEARRAEQAQWDTALLKCRKLSEMGAWDPAAEEAGKLVALRKGNPQGYLLRLLTKYRLTKPEALAECVEPYEQQEDWKLALQYSPSEQKKMLEGCLQQSQTLRLRLEKERQEAERRRAEQLRLEEEARKAEEERIEKERRDAEQAAWTAAIREAQHLREAGQWQQALDKAEQLIGMRDWKSEGYMGRLLAKRKLKMWDDLATCMEPFEDDLDWKRALVHATRAQKPKLEEYLTRSRALREAERKKREEREQREERDRLYTQNVAHVRELLQKGDWDAAWTEASALPDRVEKRLLQLLADSRLPNETALATADPDIFFGELYRDYYNEAGEVRREQLAAYREAAHENARKKRRKAATARCFWTTVLSLLGLVGYFFALQRLPDMTPVITMGAAAVAAIVMLVLMRLDKKCGTVPMVLFSGVFAGVTYCAATMWTLPAWACYLGALVMVVPPLCAGCTKSDRCRHAALPVIWLMTVIDLTLAAMLPGAALATFLCGIVSTWWFALLVVLTNLLLLAYNVIGDGIDMEEFAGGWTLLLPAMLLPHVISGLQVLLPAWAGMIVLLAAVLLLCLYGLAYNTDHFRVNAGAFVLALVLAAVAVCAAIFLSLPLWVYLAAALVLTVIILGFAVAKLDDSSAAVVLPGLWLVLHLVFQLLALFIDAPWVGVAAGILDGWIAPIVIFLAAFLTAMEVNAGKSIGVVLLGLLGLAGVGVALALLAVPTYGVVAVQHYLPDWMGLAAWGGALLAFMIYAINRKNEKYSGGGGMIFLGVLLIGATVVVTIFWPPTQLWYLIAAAALSLILTFSSLVSLAGIDPVPWPLPATIWLTLHSGVYILAHFVQAPWVAVALNITRWWLPGAAVLVWAIAIVWYIGDEEGWW